MFPPEFLEKLRPSLRPTWIKKATMVEGTIISRFQVCSLHLHLFDQTRLPLARAALGEGIGVLAISPADKGGRLYAHRLRLPLADRRLLELEAPLPAWSGA
jgi:hypothetical protein